MAQKIGESAELTTVAAVIPALRFGSRLYDSNVVGGFKGRKGGLGHRGERSQRGVGMWEWCVDAAEVGLVRSGREGMWSGTR